jgi:alpha-mannosidase
MRRLVLRAAALALAVGSSLAAEKPDRPRDLSKDKTLYCVGYAHLDTQWRWDFTTTIDKYLRATLEENFERFERHPGYVFNFTGSARYRMMKEYYPELYERLKGYVAAGRWFVSGSSVDEGDVNVPSAEAVLRQVLYGNQYFRREFGKESIDYMLPDCFGFPASMPSIWAHAGLRGFSTQKLTWGSAVGIPFTLGTWVGPDGRSVIAALDPGSYTGAIQGRVDLNPQWVERVERNGRDYGVFADYHYYGVGDQGGAPREADVANYLASVNRPDSKLEVVLGSSDQLYREITDAQAASLPRYAGDMLLTEHSAGTLTSQAAMKRWNRKGEILADAAERAAVVADWQGALRYPLDALERSWERLLLNQMHDILPGTSIPRAYTYSWNDEILAQNGFASVLTAATGAVAGSLDTSVSGVPLVVYNPLAIEREDVVEADVDFGGAAPRAVRVHDPSGREVPSQELSRTARTVKVLFLARVPPVGFSVFDVRPATSPFRDDAAPKAAERSLENAQYRVVLDEAGDIASIVDKVEGGRELLREPARLVFTREKPRQWPAWNMDWADRQKPPLEALRGPAAVRVVEQGPVRAALEVTRSARNSTVTQQIRLTRGDAGRRIEMVTDVDWQSVEVALRASFPLTVSNPKATYNWGMGTIDRGNNEPTKYEVPSHEWLDLTDTRGDYGVSVLEDCKFGSDKPDDATLRLTLLYSPGVRKHYQDQHSQDWGRHRIVYALAGHRGDWRDGRSEWQGRRLNQPLRAFQTVRKAGGVRELSFASVSSPQVDLRALKRAEDDGTVIVRLQELWGRPTGEVVVRVGEGIAAAREVDGQERPIGDAVVQGGRLVTSLPPYGPRSFALTLAPPRTVASPARQQTVTLSFDEDVASGDRARRDGRFDVEGRTLPAEQLPRRMTHGGIAFELGPTSDGATNALGCRGQRIPLPKDTPDSLYVLAAATDDVAARFTLGKQSTELSVPSWTGFVGQWDDRIWDREFAEVDYETAGRVTGFRAGFIKTADVAWFATHRHHPERGNEAYRFSYLFALRLPVPAGASTLGLPDDPRIKLLAVTAAWDRGRVVRPAAPLLDEFTGRKAPQLRHVYPPPPVPVFTGGEPVGKVTTDRASTFSALSMGPPGGRDLAEGLVFRYHDGGGEHVPHSRAGAVGTTLPRLSDGLVAQNDDDTSRSTWYDAEGRFSIDLGAARKIARVNTYSWHREERAPQWFSLWGSAAETMPDPEFAHGGGAGWTLLGVVDTRAAGAGGIHGSSVSFDVPVRYLLWVAQDVGNGTFFTEIDVHEAR